jgi:hypothetical protein
MNRRTFREPLARDQSGGPRDAHHQTAHFKKDLAGVVSLLASRKRHVWTRAAP